MMEGAVEDGKQILGSGGTNEVLGELTSPVKSSNMLTSSLKETLVCGGCGNIIHDRFYYQTGDWQWHQQCLKCSECAINLSGDHSCFTKSGRVFCKQDYQRKYLKRTCGRCDNVITSKELVMRARHLVFHLNCFSCGYCHRMLCSGEQMGVRGENIYCKPHLYMQEDVTAAFKFQPGIECCDLGGRPSNLSIKYPLGGLNYSPMILPPPPHSKDFYLPPSAVTPTVPNPLQQIPLRSSTPTDLFHSTQPASHSQPSTPTSLPPSSQAHNNNNSGVGSEAFQTSIPPVPSPVKTSRHKKKKQNESSKHIHLMPSMDDAALTFGMSGFVEMDLTLYGGLERSHQQGVSAGYSSRTKRMRTSFKHNQLQAMKQYFNTNHNPDAKDLKQLAQKTGLTKRVLQVWFQNARAKYRRNLMREQILSVRKDKEKKLLGEEILAGGDGRGGPTPHPQGSPFLHHIGGEGVPPHGGYIDDDQLSLDCFYSEDDLEGSLTSYSPESSEDQANNSEENEGQQ